MLSFLTLAVLVGMSHALEADHVAAVSSMASRQTSVKQIVRTGAVWGLGHTLTLMLFAGAAIILGFAIQDGLASLLEFVVGVMLVGLGGHILYRLWRERVHFHAHSHGQDKHFHAHSHAGEVQDHTASSHHHEHKPFPLRTLLVGMMHGMAGSAALLVLTASTAPTISSGFIYVVLFGAGSIFGMAALSVLIAVPIAYSARMLTWANRSIQGTTGLATMALGLYTMYETQLYQLLP
ncbi:hypothetical protein V5T82_01970 [Magnetovibrio sp. PR-2]|uniref:hypothetical protein n=1 Tax=Magnetovibrio sp. PR-2 TaxID=3120356 RepID=UPI002FCE1B40